MIGPAALEAPIIAPQMPIAMFSFSAGKAARSSAERGGLQQRAEQALEHPEARSPVDASRTGRWRAEVSAKPAMPIRKIRLWPEPVAELAGGDQEHGEREQIAVGDPLQVGERGAELLADDGVGDRDDRAVEHHHHHAERHREQCQPRMTLPG